MKNMWQGLGAFCSNVESVGDDRLDAFADAGGSWLAILLYNDQGAANNGYLLTNLLPKLASRGIVPWMWANYFGDDPDKFADAINLIYTSMNLKNVILDCESSVQGNTNMSKVALSCYRHFGPGFGVSTNSLNDAVVYNGRIEGLDPHLWQSFRQLGIRVAPQWYIAPRYAGDRWADPVLSMQWLSGPNGSADNLHDERAHNGRAVPLSFVHPTGEGTGLEQADWGQFLMKCHQAQQIFKFLGISYYDISQGDSFGGDMELTKQLRGVLYV